MKIDLNGAPHETGAQTLAELLAELGQEGRFATALNEEFIPEGARAAAALSAGDRVEILAPMQGG